MQTLRVSRGYEFGLACDVGRKRRGQPNQDAAEIVSGGDSPPLLLVADGMGGHRGGALASQLVVQGMKEAYQPGGVAADPAGLLRAGLQTAHRLVCERGSREADLASMGSTLVAALLLPGRVQVLNVGDSRAYLLRGNEIRQLSQDQSWVAEQVRAGILTPEQALRHPRRSHLSMAISARRPEVRPYEAVADLLPDDVLVLCSDGLWGVVPEALIWASASELSPQAAADKLVTFANANRGPDNISVIVARRYQPDRKPPSTDMDETNP